MSNIKETKTRINTVKETRKITNAMYVIASMKMRKMKEAFYKTKPYFDAIQTEVKRIFRTIDESDHNYFGNLKSTDKTKTDGYLIITADKGLAGPYNLNVINETLNRINNSNNYKLFVVGEYGRKYFETHNVTIEKNFLYTAQNPTFERAKNIVNELLNLYNKGELNNIEIIYTDMKSGMNEDVKCTKLLPLDKKEMQDCRLEEEVHFEFQPSILTVLETIIPSYLTGFVYSALVDSFCCEQIARMIAMDSANKNADKIIYDLTLQYNRLRQGSITQEITEISAGAKSYNSNKGV